MSCLLLSSPIAATLPPGSNQHAYRLPASFHGASFFLSSWGAALASMPRDSVLQHLISSGASQAQFTRPVTSISWSRGVTVSTLDSESSDRGSNPRGTSCPPRLLSFPTACFFFHVLPAAIFSYAILPPGSKQHAYRQRSAGES